MDDQKAIETGQKNNDLIQKIVEYLASKGISPFDHDFEKLVNLIKEWEESK